MALLKDDPDHRKDLEHAIKKGNDGISNKNPDEADDDDQWFTNDSVFKSLSHSSGIVNDNMNDVTPANRFWSSITCWNALIEILVYAIYWLNPPFGTN